MLTRTLAAELDGTGILVNAASPGYTLTDMSPDAQRPVRAGADTGRPSPGDVDARGQRRSDQPADKKAVSKLVCDRKQSRRHYPSDANPELGQRRAIKESKVNA